MNIIICFDIYFIEQFEILSIGTYICIKSNGLESKQFK